MVHFSSKDNMACSRSTFFLIARPIFTQLSMKWLRDQMNRGKIIRTKDTMLLMHIYKLVLYELLESSFNYIIYLDLFVIYSYTCFICTSNAGDRSIWSKIKMITY